MTIDKDELKDKVVQLFAEAEKKEAISPTITVNGNGNMVSGGSIVINQTVPQQAIAKRDSEWRSYRYRHNHAVAKQFNLYPQMRAFIMENFGVHSQRDLTDHELNQVYRRMAAWKQAP